MATVTAGQTTTYTFTTNDSVQVDVAPGEVANIQVFNSAGVRVFGSPVNRTQIIGPFDVGSVMTITAVRGDVDYTIVDQESAATPVYMNSKRQLVTADGALLPATPGVLRCAIFGSSTDQHCFANAEGTLVVSNGVGTWTSAEGNHLLQTGCLVSLNKDNPSTDFQRNTATAAATRVSATALRFDLPNWPDGSGLMDAHFLTAYAQPSWVRKLRSLSGGSIDIVATLAVGGEQTTRKLTYWRDLLKLDINCVIGAFGIGNDILGGVDPAITIANMTTMIDGLTKAGLVVVVLMAPATANMTTPQEARGQKITNALLKLRASNPLLYIADEYTPTINPATGQGKSGIFIGDGVHLSRVGKDLVATQAHYPALQSILAKPISRLISSVNDCTSKEATNPQAMTGFWLNTGTTASTLSAKAAGTVDANITAIAVGGASAVLNCSLVARSDGFGYDQVLEFVPGGNNQSFQVDLTGFASYITAGDYFVGCSLSITIDSGLEVNGYGHFITATIGGADARVTENYRTEHGVSNEPKLTTNITEDLCLFPTAKFTATPSAASWVFALNTGARGTAGNKVTVRIGRPTIRPLA